MQGFATSTGELTADTLIVQKKGALCSVLVITDGTNAATVLIYDNTSAAGKKIAEFTVAGATGYGGRNWIFPVGYENGLYMDISGTGASAIVEYV